VRHAFGKLIDRAAILLALAGGCVLLLIIAVSVTNSGLFMADRVAGLWDSNIHGLSGYEDFVGLATGTAMVLMLPYCQIRHGHIAVEILAQRLPVMVNHWLGVVWLIIMAITALGLGTALLFGLIELRDDMAVSRVLGWPCHQPWPLGHDCACSGD